MRSLNRKNIATSLVLILGGVTGFSALVIACGDDSATIAGGDASADVSADTSPTQQTDGSGTLDAAAKDSSAADTGTQSTDAGADANARTANPDGGCDSVQDGEIFVDPTNGSDTATTPGGYVGQTYSAACAFKTIGAALAYAGATPAAGTKIFVVGSATVQAGETFPIVVPANVEIRGVGPGAVTISPTTNTSAFTLNAHPSLLTNLTIVGGTSTASGVVVDTGSDATTAITDLNVSAFANGINVQNTGIVSIAAGANGTKLTSNSGAGLLLSGTAKATLAAAAASGGIVLSMNKIGIDVQGTAVLNAVGVASATAGSGSIVVTKSTDQGIFIEGSTGANVLTGVVAYQNGTDGIEIYDTSTVIVRSVQSIGNTGNGINVTKGGITPAAPTNVDLGKAADGKNVLKTNTSAGVCFATTSIATLNALTLSAQGNLFSALDCSANASHPTHASTCAGGVDVGGVTTGATTTKNVVDVTMCTLQ